MELDTHHLTPKHGLVQSRIIKQLDYKLYQVDATSPTALDLRLEVFGTF